MLTSGGEDFVVLMRAKLSEETGRLARSKFQGMKAIRLAAMRGSGSDAGISILRSPGSLWPTACAKMREQQKTSLPFGQLSSLHFVII